MHRSQFWKMSVMLMCLALTFLASSANASVIISSLSGQGQLGQIYITWTTASESNNTGFNVLRSESSLGPYIAINTLLIASPCNTCLGATDYLYADSGIVAGLTYYYKIQSIEATNVTEEFGPIAASSVQPNADGYRYFLPAISLSDPRLCDPYPLLDWDSRLGNGANVLPHLEGVQLIPASVAAGQKYWRVIRVKFEDIDESGNDHTIYVKVQGADCQRASGQRMLVTSVGGLHEYPYEKLDGDLCNCNFDYPMYGDGYGVEIEDGYPSDKVAGMIMPLNRHVNYRITFQLTTNP